MSSDMNTRELWFRPMEARDLSIVVSIHLRAFAGYKSSILGPRFVDRLYRWFLTHDPGFAVVAEADGAVCGFAAGARLGSGPAVTRFTASAAVKTLLGRPWLLAHPEIVAGCRLKLQQMHHPAPPLPSLPGAADLPTAALAGIAVAPEQQGRGVGAHLMRAFEEEAIRRGYRRGWLSVRRDNASASRLYRRCGWDECLPPSRRELSLYVKLFEAGTVADRNIPVSPAGVRHE
jgi:ribosomal protein S18 acetylase RimI-like enzyme